MNERLSAVKVRRVLTLRYEDGTDIADAVDHATSHSHYEMGAIVKWVHNGIEMECCEENDRRERMEYYHNQRRAKEAKEIACTKIT